MDSKEPKVTAEDVIRRADEAGITARDLLLAIAKRFTLTPATTKPSRVRTQTTEEEAQAYCDYLKDPLGLDPRD